LFSVKFFTFLFGRTFSVVLYLPLPKFGKTENISTWKIFVQWNCFLIFFALICWKKVVLLIFAELRILRFWLKSECSVRFLTFLWPLFKIAAILRRCRCILRSLLIPCVLQSIALHVCEDGIQCTRKTQTFASQVHISYCKMYMDTWNPSRRTVYTLDEMLWTIISSLSFFYLVELSQKMLTDGFCLTVVLWWRNTR